jgi:hypothetical protein
MTDVYAHMHDQTLKHEWLQTKERVNAAGGRVALTTPPIDDDAAWLKHQVRAGGANAARRRVRATDPAELPASQRLPLVHGSRSPSFVIRRSGDDMGLILTVAFKVPYAEPSPGCFPAIEHRSTLPGRPVSRKTRPMRFPMTGGIYGTARTPVSPGESVRRPKAAGRARIGRPAGAAGAGRGCSLGLRFAGAVARISVCILMV